MSHADQGSIAQSPRVHLFLDESGTSASDNWTLIGATAVLDVGLIESEIKSAFERVLGDGSLWVGQADKRAKFRETGFHFTEDNESVKDAFLSAMGALEYRAYVAFARRDPSRDVVDVLIEMYGTLLNSVLARYRESELTVVFEQNSSMDPVYPKLWTVLKEEVRDIESARAYRGTKHAPCLAITDYVLGVTRLHLGESPPDFHRRRFAALAPRLAYLIDFDDDGHFGGRKHPIL